MNIAYRRMSGAIGITFQERGQRGLWWEKRRALVHTLRARGHRVDFCSRYSPPTQQSLGLPVALNKAHDLLMIEFGSSNQSFYSKDLAETAQMAAMHRGPIVYLCDDPDLYVPYRDWGPHMGWERWTILSNATEGHLMGGPHQFKHHDLPFASLMEARRPGPHYCDRAVYLGRPGGRKRVINRLLESPTPVRWQVLGKQNEWDRAGYPQVVCSPPPHQPQRADFYSIQRASLVLADARHKRLGWRTGRAYHAVLAGCPAIVEHDHPALRSFASFEEPARINDYLAAWADPHARESAWERQHEQVLQERAVAEQTLAAVGL